MFVTVSVLIPVLCLFTHSLFVMCLWYILVYIVFECVCVCVYCIQMCENYDVSEF